MCELLNIIVDVRYLLRYACFISIFLNSCLIPEGWRLKIDLEHHYIINLFILQTYLFEYNKHSQIKSVKR